MDKDKINIRVGGGYLSIDEFLDQYTPEEMSKIERKDPLRRLGEKIEVVSRIKRRETSPPQQQAKAVLKSKSRYSTPLVGKRYD